MTDMETSESEQETEMPLQVTILDTVQKSKSVEKIFSENVSFDEFDKEFNDILDSILKNQFLSVETWLKLSEKMTGNAQKLEILSKAVIDHPASLKLWLNYLQCSANEVELLSSGEILKQFCTAIESTKFYFKEATQIFEVIDVILEVVQENFPNENFTKLTLYKSWYETPLADHDSVIEKYQSVVSDEMVTEKYKEKILQRFSNLENQIPNADNVTSENAWDFSMNWLKYANGLNNLLKAIQIPSSTFPFERAVSTIPADKLGFLSEQFWTVFLNHIEFDKTMSDEVKIQKKKIILSKVTRISPWFGKFWAQLIDISDEKSDIFQNALTAPIESIQETLSIFQIYLRSGQTTFQQLVDKLVQLEEFYPTIVNASFKEEHESFGLDHDGSLLLIHYFMSSQIQKQHAKRKLLNSHLVKSSKFWCSIDVFSDPDDLKLALSKIDTKNTNEISFSQVVLHQAELMLGYYSQEVEKFRNQLRKATGKTEIFNQHTPAKRRRVQEEPKAKESEKNTEPARKFKVFLSNIDKKTEFPKNVIERWFKKIGVTPLEIDPAFQGSKFRGFAVACLKSAKELQKVLSKDREPTEDNRPLYVSEYNGSDSKSKSEEPRVFNYEKDQEDTKLYISNLKWPEAKDETKLKNLFEKFGKIISLRIPTNKSGKEKRPYCYLEFETAEAAANAVKEINLTEFEGNPINVAISKPPPRKDTVEKKRENLRNIREKQKPKVVSNENIPSEKEPKEKARPMVMFMPRTLK